MANLKIIGVPQSNFVWVVRMACAEKGVPYELVPVRPHTPEIDAVHPLGRIPGMRHGDLALFESKAIATYIDRAFPGPKLIPDDPAQAGLVEQWVSFINTTLDPVMVRGYLLAYFFPGTPDGAPDRARIDAALPAMRQQIGILDRAVTATGFLAGPAFTLADIDLLPILYYLLRLPEGGEMVKEHRNLHTYYERHAERPSFKATVPPPPPAR